MTPDAKARLAVFVVGWLAMGVITVVAWSLTFGKWFREAARSAEKGARCLEIADAYRELRRNTGFDGEAYTYEQAAKFWEDKARSHGVERMPLSARQPKPTPVGHIVPPRVPPWQA